MTINMEDAQKLEILEMVRRQNDLLKFVNAKKQYGLVGSYHNFALCEEVNRALAEGWELYGNTFCRTDGYFYQALTKTIDEPVNKS